MTASTAATGVDDTDERLSALRRVATAPFTHAYLLLLLGTTLLLRNVSAELADRLLTGSSTDVAHLTHAPIRVLIASALWLPGRWWLPYALMFLLVLAPLERRFGVRRTLLIFLSGHVLATLLTELPIGVAIALHQLAPSEAHRLDVGVSYGIYTAVAAYAGSLPRRATVLVLLGALVSIVVPEAADPDMTMWGHLLSLVIGVCWWRFLYRRPRAA